MSGLTAFGLAAVAAMLTFYALEDHSPVFVFAFAMPCVDRSVYEFAPGGAHWRRRRRDAP